jgi:hypothetical protein
MKIKPGKPAEPAAQTSLFVENPGSFEEATDSLSGSEAS